MSKNNDRTREPIDPRWASHYLILTDLRAKLSPERDQRRRDVAESLEEHVIDPDETAADAADREVLMAELGSEEAALREIDAALKRIEEGAYGICEETGKRIPAERLRAVPWTRLCKDAAERLERNAGGALGAKSQ